MILERIRQQYPLLTRSQRKLADFLVGSYQSAAFMTAKEYAAFVGVNEATVIRFAQRLGYAGFPAMIEEVRQIVHQDLLPGGHLDQADAVEKRFHAALSGQAELIQRTMRQVPPDVVAASLDALLGARHVIVVGQGPTGTLAGYFASALAAIGIDARSADVASLDLTATLTAADETTTVVGVSMDEADERTARILAFAMQQHARTIAITDSAISPAARAAELAITISSAGGLATPSAAALIAVMDALVNSAADRRGARREANGRVDQYRAMLRTRERLLTGQEQP